MSFYSANGVKRVFDVQAALDGDPDIVRVREANVSQFGWTTNDLKSVKDLVTWVAVAIEAAETAQANAKYVEDSVAYVAERSGEVDNSVNAANTMLASVTSLYNDFIPKYNTFNTNYADFVSKYNDFIVKYNDFIEKFNIWAAENLPDAPITP